MSDGSYFNFDLILERAGEKYRARVFDSPAGQASTEFKLPLSELELENFVLRMGRPRSGVRRVDSTELEAVKECGERLFQAVFANDVYACFLRSRDAALEEGKGLRIRLRIDVPEFHDYPWEFLYNAHLNQFLALSKDTPVIRYLELPYPVQPLTVQPPLKILVMISSPEGFPQLNVEEEWRRLSKALAPFIRHGLVNLDRLKNPTLSALQQHLRRGEYHIFHFIGHGKFSEHKQDGMLLLEDKSGKGQPVSGQYLGMVLHDHHSLRLVVLNACEGARTSQSDPYAGVAQALVQQGIPAVIAMQFPINEDSAVEFAYEFYGAIADGFPVDASISEARKAIFTTGNETEWATPVLFMNSPDGMIFDLQAAQKTLPLDVTEASESEIEEFASGSEEEIASPKRLRLKLVPIWSRLALGLALLGLMVVMGLWLAGIYASPEAPVLNTSALNATSTITLPTNTVTFTALPTATVTSTPLPSATPYPNEVRDSKNVAMVLIPAGNFVMGNNSGQVDEKPEHTVYMDAYYIDKYEVSNEQYELCVLLKVCRRPIDIRSFQRLNYFGSPLFANYPVINVTFEMARAYCEDWRGARLPTEAEWEKAARGPDGSTYPWGEEIDCNHANYRDKACERVRDTSPVTSFPNGVSAYGVYNMSGNVWEWVKDWYSPAFYLNSPMINPTGPEHAVVGIYYIKRGGSFQDEWQKLRTTNREKNDPTNYGSNLGFRCVRPISGEAP